jgi:hypothetical protein
MSLATPSATIPEEGVAGVAGVEDQHPQRKTPEKQGISALLRVLRVFAGVPALPAYYSIIIFR